MQSELLHHCNLCESALLDVLDADCNIARCRSCGFVFDNPRPTLESLIDFYSKPGKYDSWLAELDARDRLWKRRLRKLRSTRKPGSLLDIGTGIGQFLSVAHGEYSQVFGTEVSRTAVEVAKDKYGLDLFQGTVEDLAQTRMSFDNITLFHVLEHVPDPRALLQTCSSLLTPGGVLVIAVPNEVSSIRAIVRRALVAAGLKKPGNRGKVGLPRIRLDESLHEIHLSHFTPKVLANLVESTGFSVLFSTLDPYYVRSGLRRVSAGLYYRLCLALKYLVGLNVYDAILLIARKDPDV